MENQWFRDRKHASMLGYRRVDRITLWLFNIAMENGPFIDDFPMKTSIYGWDVPWLC